MPLQPLRAWRRSPPRRSRVNPLQNEDVGEDVGEDVQLEVVAVAGVVVLELQLQQRLLRQVQMRRGRTVQVRAQAAVQHQRLLCQVQTRQGRLALVVALAAGVPAAAVDAREKRRF